jgi:chromosome partitioning protein
MKIISFYNRKGGVGKTALSFLFSRFLVASGKKVLVLDLDPQKSLTNHFERLNSIPREEVLVKNACNLLLGRSLLEENLIRVDGNIDILPASYDLSEIQGNVTILSLKHSLKSMKNKYDYCIMDNSPNFSTLIQASLAASEVVIIPTLPNIEDLEQAAWTFKKITSVSQAKRKVILNRIKPEGGNKLEKGILEFFRPVFEDSLLESSIPQSGLIQRYTLTGEKINRLAKAKKLFMEAFAGFVKEVTGKI